MNTIRIARKTYLFLFLFIFFFTLLYVFILDKETNDQDRSSKLMQIQQLIQTKSNYKGCHQPDLPLYPPEIMKFVKNVPKIDCSQAGIDWVKCRGSDCTIQEEAKAKYGPIKCSFTDVIRVDDYRNRYGTKTYSDSYYKLEQSDVVRVYCDAASHKWSATLYGIRFDKHIWEGSSWDNLPHNALKMNVLMFGFDSMSRNSFIRKLPKTYDYLQRTLHSIVLEGYNIVGDGTPQALIPILTGQTELELPDTRKRFKNTQFVDVYPFIWKYFKHQSYVTGFFEDVPELSTFTYRLNGFNETPTDHYMRPYYLASLGERRNWPKLCAGDTPRHKIMLNAITDFFSFYKSKPKFLFGFHGELSHDDYNLIGVADDDVVDFLKNLHSSHLLNNTILIIMADHGHRFADIRNTMQGKQEERLPFFSFTFPPWFAKKHRKIYENLLSNKNKLTTPFDIFATLKDVIYLENDGLADISKRSVSLFSKIPETRSCAHAYIEPHWCACLDWEPLSLDNPMVDRLSATLLNTINNYTKNYRDICEKLLLNKVMWATQAAPNDFLVKFNKNADKDGFLADLSAKTKITKEIYQIKVVLDPGESIFEASIVHLLNNDELMLKIEDISRINMYGRQARCVEKELPHLRKYCYCKGD